MEKEDAGNGEGEVEENTSDSVPEYIKAMISKPTELYKYMFENEDAPDAVKPVGWELTGMIMTFVKDDAAKEDMQCCEKCLTKVAEFSAPKELYLGLLEHFDPGSEVKHVELLLPALSVALRKLYEEDIKACAAVLETTYATLSYYTESLNLPNYDKFDPDLQKRKVFEALKIERFLKKAIMVLKPIIEKICANQEKLYPEFEKFRNHPFQYLCSVLVILGQLDLDASDLDAGDDAGEGTEEVNLPAGPHGDSTKNAKTSKDAPAVSSILDLCNSIMQMTVLFYSPTQLWNSTNWHGLHPAEELSEEGRRELEKQEERGRSCYLFLLFCRDLLYDLFPKIYSSQNLFVKSALSVNALLSCKNQCVVWKGLDVLKHILDRVGESSLSCSEIQHYITCYYSSHQLKTFPDPIKTLLRNLINVATLLPSKAVRTKAVQLLTTFLDKFSWSDKYFLLVHLLKTADHSGVCGLLIGFVKDKLDQITRIDPPEGCEQFCNAKKMTLLGEIIFNLPDGVETDLLVECDRIMPALNLLRFILLRDKENKTGVFDHTTKIEKDFLKPLRTGLDMSRAHYESELAQYNKKSTVPKQNLSTEPEFSINGVPLPSLPFEEQEKTLKAALHSFDMMEIVAVRVGELINER